MIKSLHRKLFLGLFVLLINGKQVNAQIDSIYNGVLTVKFNSSMVNNFIEVKHTDNPDALVLDNLSIWIYAKNSSKTGISIQKNNNYNDFASGPNYTSVMPNNFLSAQKVSQEEISYHSLSFSQQGYSPVVNIKNWPASFNGNTYGAFVDFNGNSIYEPQMGDYPLIRGAQSLIKIENDKTNLLRSSIIPAVGIEATQYFFIFPKAGNPILDNIVGFRWVLKNISGMDWDTALTGINFHSPISPNNYNYIGTDVTNNAMIIYPKSNNSKPFSSLVILNQSIKSTHYYTNSSSNQNGTPMKDSSFLNYLNSKWINGKDVTRGNTGVDGIQKTNFVFSNNTSNDTIWNEDIEGNTAGDRSGLIVCQQTNWKNGTYKIIEGAFMFNRFIDSFGEIYEKHRFLKNAYNIGNFTSIEAINKEKIKIFPNPVYHSGNIFIESSVFIIKEVKLLDFMAKEINSSKINQHNASMDITGCQKGLYFIYLHLENDKVLTYPVNID